MPIKVENQYEGKLPKNTVELIEKALDSLPREHTRGIERVRLVEFISEPRLKGQLQMSELPGLYHPRQGAKGPWLEVAVGVLLPGKKPIHKRIIPRLSFKGNIAAVIFSLVGQHYHLTLRHSMKRTQVEPADFSVLVVNNFLAARYERVARKQVPRKNSFLVVARHRITDPMIFAVLKIAKAQAAFGFVPRHIQKKFSVGR